MIVETLTAKVPKVYLIEYHRRCYVKKRKPIKKNWVIVGNEYHLFVEVNGKVFCEKFRVYGESAVETNKKLREFDLIEKVEKETGTKIDLV